MIVTCQSCGSNERTDERFLAGRTSLQRCSTCSGLMIAEALTNFETRRWWAGICGKICGPFTAREVKALIEHGEIHGGSYMWTFDMHGWELIDQSPRLAFAAAWYRELHLPYLEPVVGEVLESANSATPAPTQTIETIDAIEEIEATPPPRGWLSAGSMLGEAGLHVAVVALTLAVLGSGVAAGGAIFS